MNVQTDKSSNAATSGNVKVVCRFRPINERQKALGIGQVYEALDDKTVAVKDKESKDPKDSLMFSFDKVFGSNSQQKEIYEYAAASVIDSVIEGFNGTIFAYGQTSSGKTYTMEGDVSKQVTATSGIIPRMVQHVFNAIQNFSENVQFRIKVSLVELYMEKLRDLIDPRKTDLKIRSDKKRGVFIEDLTENYISSPEEVYEFIEAAHNSRATACTNMNEHSSRSHMIFLLSINQNNLNDLSAKTGKLYLVDLAGSEKISKTGAEGKVLDEAKKINTSLAALGKVINALTDGKSTHIPYRDSKLTRVLQESLGGNSKTTLIVTCSPHINNIAQTISTLRFGVSAKKIKNKPKINKEMTVAELQNLLQKVEREVAERDAYLSQLSDYISNGLKAKVPQFQKEKEVSLQNNDMMAQMERQLEMEKSLQLVQEEQISSLKAKNDELTAENDKLEAENQALKLELTERPQKTQKKEIIQEKVGQSQAADSQSLQQLLKKYQYEKERRSKAQQTIRRNQKVMQKKLTQLENNICQLTHAYYDLVVVQQRYKVDNIFLKKSMQEKDVFIAAQREKIKDLQDQNRELEEQKWNDQEVEPKARRLIQLAESGKHFQEALERKQNHPKLVKVLKGGVK